MIVILDNLRSALNVGSIIRTCDALGIKDVYFCGITPEVANPKVLKTALGAEQNIRPCYFTTTLEAIMAAKENGFPVLALEITEKAVPLNKLKRLSESALIIGNEVSGVSKEALVQADQTVMIPMSGVKESMNVAVAFGIAAYQLSSK